MPADPITLQEVMSKARFAELEVVAAESGAIPPELARASVDVVGRMVRDWHGRLKRAQNTSPAASGGPTDG